MSTGEPDIYQDDEDTRRMLAVGKGNDDALSDLIDRWQGPLVNFFYRSINSVEQAQDLAQMTFIRLYRSAPGYKPVARFSTYLFHIARRLLINEYRRRQRKPADPCDPTDLQDVADETCRDTTDMRELEEAFQAALEKLSEDQRTAILLLKQQELSYEEIGKIMGQPLSAVKTHIFRARQKLKILLKTHLEGESPRLNN